MLEIVNIVLEINNIIMKAKNLAIVKFTVAAFILGLMGFWIFILAFKHLKQLNRD